MEPPLTVNEHLRQVSSELHAQADALEAEAREQQARLEAEQLPVRIRVAALYRQAAGLRKQGNAAYVAEAERTGAALSGPSKASRGRKKARR
jgi:hypothetical protein